MKMGVMPLDGRKGLGECVGNEVWKGGNWRKGGRSRGCGGGKCNRFDTVLWGFCNICAILLPRINQKRV